MQLENLKAGQPRPGPRTRQQRDRMAQEGSDGQAMFSIDDLSLDALHASPDIPMNSGRLLDDDAGPDDLDILFGSIEDFGDEEVDINDDTQVAGAGDEDADLSMADLLSEVLKDLESDGLQEIAGEEDEIAEGNMPVVEGLPEEPAPPPAALAEVEVSAEEHAERVAERKEREPEKRPRAAKVGEATFIFPDGTGEIRYNVKGFYEGTLPEAWQLLSAKANNCWEAWSGTPYRQFG